VNPIRVDDRIQTLNVTPSGLAVIILVTSCTGYRDGDRAMYVSPYNNFDDVLFVSDDIRAAWSSLWQESSDEFDFMLEKDSDLSQFVGKMFFVWEENHRLTARFKHINKHHSMDKN
jgi:uncharacterized Rossmann fold enzyme